MTQYVESQPADGLALLDRRFYDREPVVKNAIVSLSGFTDELLSKPGFVKALTGQSGRKNDGMDASVDREQAERIATILAKGMSLFAIRDFGANEIISGHESNQQQGPKRKSLGAKTVLALYKSKQKKRGFDANTDFHNALNHLLVLSPEERTIIATKTLDMLGYVRHYIGLCENTVSAPTAEKVQTIRDTYVMQGEGQVKHYIERVSIDMLKNLPFPSEQNKIVIDNNVIRSKQNPQH